MPPRRAVYAALAAILGPVLLIHGYTRHAVTVFEKKETEEKLPPEMIEPAGMLADGAEKPPTMQKIVVEVSKVIREKEAIVRVVSGTISRSPGGKLMITEAKDGAARCPT